MRVEEEDSEGVTCQGEGEGGRERDVTLTTLSSRHVKTRLLATEITGDENIGLLPESSLLCSGGGVMVVAVVVVVLSSRGRGGQTDSRGLGRGTAGGEK